MKGPKHPSTKKKSGVLSSQPQISEAPILAWLKGTHVGGGKESISLKVRGRDTGVPPSLAGTPPIN